jgi:uncharacterized protein YndB with AHSA1/START domain
MAESRFVYVTLIRTTPEALWDALTQPEWTRRYWAGTHQESDFTKGSPWKAFAPDGRLIDSGQVLEADRPRKLVLTWKHHIFPELAKEPASRLTYEIEPAGSAVKLTLIHESEAPDSKLIAGVTEGWPYYLSSLKSLLETGQPIAETAKWPEGI